MRFPKPVPGLVVRYSYLWHAEHQLGVEEGVKDRPCALVLATKLDGGRTITTVLPITHSKPLPPTSALEIPRVVKERLGLDSERSWVVLTELNRFRWPGPDLRAVPGKHISTVAYGMLPQGFFSVLQEKFLAAYKAEKTRVVARTE